MFRRLTPFQLTVDIGVAVFCLLVRATMSFDNLFMWVVVVLMATALALRRVSPGLALAVAWVGAVLQMAAGLSPDVSNTAIPAVLYVTARYGGRIVKWSGLASAGVGALVSTFYVVFVLGGFFDYDQLGSYLRVLPFALVGAVTTLGLSWTLGLLARTWANAREARRNQLAAERDVVVEQERNRIARDMHDVVAHSLAVVIAQADGARYAKAAGDKDEALATISSTAREALSDVRVLLGQLRHSQEPGPQPVLADLDRLVEQLRSSGLVVAVEQRGTPVPLHATRELAIYRIVQEALTNALRHGDTEEEVVVLIEWAADAATLTISNAVGPGAPNPDGHGLAGMRERAILVGGTFEAGRRDDRWVVSARIPA